MPALSMAEETFFFGLGQKKDVTLMNDRLTMTESLRATKGTQVGEGYG